MKHILVVEDEQHLAIGIQFNLEREGYRVSVAGDGPAALRILDNPSDPVDLLVLDLMLPGMSGYTVCETVREAGNQLPILILSARTLPEDRARGFDAGTDQYMMKPFELAEFISRIKNLLTKHAIRIAAPREPTEVRRYKFGNAEVDFENFEATVAGQQVRITPLELRCLQYFVSQEGRVVPRHELLEQVWELPGHLNTRAPDRIMRRLRQLFEPDPAEPKHFVTLRDVGYRFVGDPKSEG